MPMPEVAMQGLLIVAGMGATAWLISLVHNNVTIVDSLWPLFLLSLCGVYLVQLSGTEAGDVRRWLILTAVTLWAVRLCVYLTLRNAGKPEDHRYRAIRANNEPGFRWKSLYIVFLFQALLAWLIAMPFLPVATSAAPVGLPDAIGFIIWIAGFAVQVTADWQLGRFRRDPANRTRVLNTGIWRYSRHPNYFGEACMWWGVWVVAFAAGGVWTVISPLLMTFLLLRVSGVALLEKDIGERRPGYAEYVASTSAFFPWPPRGQM